MSHFLRAGATAVVPCTDGQSRDQRLGGVTSLGHSVPRPGLRPAAPIPSSRLLRVLVARWTSSFCAAAVLAAALLLSAAAVSAQMNTAEITGQVKDPSSALIPGATVVATMAATQQKYTAVSNDS